MAKYGKSLAQVVVEINDKQQVQQVLKAMEESAEKLRAKIDQTKAEQAELTARKAESNWAWQYWQGVADKLKEEALALPLEEIC